jgi:hypothetical protein
MSRIEKRIIIDEATERVFCYVGEPVKSPEMWPGLLEVREVHRLIGGVSYANWVYKTTGIFETLDIRLEYAADQRTLARQLRGLDLVLTLDYQADRACGPRLALDGDYTYWSQN